MLSLVLHRPTGENPDASEDKEAFRSNLTCGTFNILTNSKRVGASQDLRLPIPRGQYTGRLDRRPIRSAVSVSYFQGFSLETIYYGLGTVNFTLDGQKHALSKYVNADASSDTKLISRVVAF